jgi:hypothetical protein
MPTTPSAAKSSTNSPETDWLDLDLPEVTGENSPLDHPEPSSLLIHEHSVILAAAASDEVWEERRRLMNPERFDL